MKGCSVSTYTMNPVSDFRDEGWILTGLSSLNAMWGDGGVDTNYASNPANKGRAAVGFQQDIPSTDIPAGSVIQSVSVFVRANSTDGTSRSLTVNTIPLDDTGSFLGRTIPLSQTITTYQVATYTQDGDGRPWTRDTLNQLALQVFTYDSGGAVDKVRVYELYAVVNYSTVPTVTITAPAGTVSSASPQVQFSYAQVDGDIQQSAAYKIFTAPQVSDPTFSPDYTPAVYPAAQQYTIQPGDTLFGIAAQFLGDGNLWPQIYAASSLSSGDPNLIYPGEIATIPGVAAVVGDVTSFTLPFALAQGDYFIYLQVTSTSGAVSPWASKEFVVSSASSNPGSPGGSLGGVGTGGGGGFDTVIADPQTSNVFLTVQSGSNLLDVQDADFESLLDPIGWVGSNCTVSQDLTVAFGAGGASMRVTASSAGNMTVTSKWVAVDAQSPLTFRAQLQAGATGRTVAVSVAFVNDFFVDVPSPATGSITDATGTFTELVVTDFNAPLGATMAQITLTVQSAAANEFHNIDHIGLMYGTDSAWSNGGHASRNLLTASQSCGDDPVFPVGVEPWTADTYTTYSRVATTGTGADGSKAFKMLYNGPGAAAISYVATGTVFSTGTPGAVYTLNKPSGVAAGNVLVAYVATLNAYGTTAPTVNPPPGWVSFTTVTDPYVSMSVLLHDVTGSDPASWSGTLSGSANCTRATVVAYAGAAPSAQQFQAANTHSSLSGNAITGSASVTNTLPNAWRLSAFALDVAGVGSMTANTVPASQIPPISYVSTAFAGLDTNEGNNVFTVNCPPDILAGDLLVAAVNCTVDTSFNVPSGWILAAQPSVNDGQGDGQALAVMVRTATSSEPSSWSGTVNAGTGAPLVTQCVAYRNCDVAANQFLAQGNRTYGAPDNVATFFTPVVNNTNSNAWRVSIFGTSTNGGSSLSTNETVQRCDDSNYVGDGFNSDLSIADSNGPVSTGGSQTTAVASNDMEVNFSIAWMGFLKPATTPQSQGGGDTDRQDNVAGTANPYLELAVFDSNGSAQTGPTRVYGQFSGSTVNNGCSFLGFLAPATPVTSGQAGCTLTNFVDLRNLSQDVWQRAGNVMTVQAAFLGSTVGQPNLELYCYTGSEQISYQVLEGFPFNTGSWTKSVGTFVVPVGTTRVKVGVTAANRNVNDYVLFDRVSAALGSDTVYRQGTDEPAHPVFAVPLVEYAEDLGQGYGAWQTIDDIIGAPLSYDNDTGLCSFQDMAMVPLSARKYRARTLSYGLAGDQFVSDYGPVSQEVTLVAENWWLKDVTTPANSMVLKLYAYALGGGLSGTSVLSVDRSDTSTSFQPLGRPLPVIVTEGYKGDVFSVSAQVDSNDFLSLMNLLEQRRTLFLQSNFDKAWWVRPFGDITSNVQATFNMSSNPLRFVQIQFVEVDPPGGQ